MGGSGATAERVALTVSDILRAGFRRRTQRGEMVAAQSTWDSEGESEKVNRGRTVAGVAHLVASAAEPFIISLMKREVGAELEVEITAPTTLEFQIAIAPHPNTEVSERLSFALDGNPVQYLEISGMHGNRIHKMDAPLGNLKVDYAATIVGRTDPAPITEYDLSMYLRPSRYAEADKFYGFAATEFGNFTDSATLLEKVSLWVGTRLNYVPGSSDPIDGAVDTLLAGAGVCRDFAHLVVALLRAVNVPARVVSVYAPGLYPMEFHAVAEAFVGGQWRVVDGTLLAPRQTLVRIATGRDAADIAFLDNHRGAITLNKLAVTAVVDGDLPCDSIHELVSIG
jgi:hypothetical protein